MPTHHTAQTLADSAFRATGHNPHRRPTGEDVAHAVRFAVEATLEEFEDLSNVDLRLVLESVLVIANAGIEGE